MIKFDEKNIFTPETNEITEFYKPEDLLYFYRAELRVNKKVFRKYFKEQREGSSHIYELIPKGSPEAKLEMYSGALLKASIYFSASPTKKEDYYIKYRDDAGLPEEYYDDVLESDLITQSDIRDILNQEFSVDLTIRSFRVHNVGQGAMNSLFFKDGTNAFFDIGITRYTDKDPLYQDYVEVFKRMRKNRKNTQKNAYDKYKHVILSHWDEDHYNGVLHAENELIEKCWITPDVEIGSNQYRLAKLIEHYGKLLRLDLNMTNEVYSRGDMTLFMGRHTGSKRNNSGIIIYLENSETNLLGPGDASYSAMSFFNDPSHRDRYKKLDYLIVPHHGADSNMGTCFFEPKVTVSQAADRLFCSVAVISVGVNQVNFGHPTSNTLSMLNDLGFMIQRTDQVGSQYIKF